MKNSLAGALFFVSTASFSYQINEFRVEKVPVYDNADIPQKVGELVQGQTRFPLAIKRIDGERGLLEIEANGLRGWIRKGMVKSDIVESVAAKCVASANTNMVAGIRGAEKDCGK